MITQYFIEILRILLSKEEIQLAQEKEEKAFMVNILMMK